GMGVKTLRNKLVPTRTLAREGRNRFRRLADGCDPEAGCNAPDIRVLMRAFTVASRKRAPAPRYGAPPHSRGEGSSNIIRGEFLRPASLAAYSRVLYDFPEARDFCRHVAVQFRGRAADRFG